MGVQMIRMGEPDFDVLTRNKVEITYYVENLSDEEIKELGVDGQPYEIEISGGKVIFTADVAYAVICRKQIIDKTVKHKDGKYSMVPKLVTTRILRKLYGLRVIENNVWEASLPFDPEWWPNKDEYDDLAAERVDNKK